MTSRALRLVATRMHGPGAAASATFVVLGGPPPRAQGWQGLRAVPAINCASLAEVHAARDALAGHPGAVALYDLEAWDLTPRRERRDPAAYAARAAAALRGTGVALAVAPSLSLAQELAPGRSPEQAYADARLIEGIAPCCDVFHIQSQRLERAPERYARFVVEAAERSRAINPRLRVTAGLSTNPPGSPVAMEQLVACVELTHNAVDGYWLNVPRPGRRCPRCNPENPALAAALLAVLGADGPRLRVQRAGDQ